MYCYFDYSAENALKTGNLLDLLQTVAVASRSCTHPCLTSTQPQSSHYFQRTFQELLNSNRPSHGPFVFRFPFDSMVYQSCKSLMFDTPELVIDAVKTLRQSELSPTTLEYFNLSKSLESPVYVRDRIRVLGCGKQIKSNLSSPKLNTTSISIANTNTNGHLTTHHQQSSFNTRTLISNGTHVVGLIANGVPASLSNHYSSVSTLDADIEMVSIPQRQKRARTYTTVSTCPISAQIYQTKRRRLVENSNGGVINHYSTRTNDDSSIVLISVSSPNKTSSRTPFLCPEAYRYIEWDRARRSHTDYESMIIFYYGSYDSKIDMVFYSTLTYQL